MNANEASKPACEPQKFDHIEAKSITLKSKDGGPTVALHAMDNCAGLWITPANGKGCIALYTQENGQTAIGLYGPDMAQKSKGMPIALYVDDEGNPKVQLCNTKGDFFILGLDEVKKLVGSGS